MQKPANGCFRSQDCRSRAGWTLAQIFILDKTCAARALDKDDKGRVQKKMEKYGLLPSWGGGKGVSQRL